MNHIRLTALLISIICLGSAESKLASAKQTSPPKTNNVNSKLEPAWSKWKDGVHKKVFSTFTRFRNKHPEYQTLVNNPAEVMFVITNQQEVKNIKLTRKSVLKDFDTSVAAMLLCLQDSSVAAFPAHADNKFVKCRICFYPHGELSDITIDTVRSDEIFTDTDLAVPFKPNKISHPDAVSF